MSSACTPTTPLAPLGARAPFAETSSAERVVQVVGERVERKWLDTRHRLEQRALEQVSEGIFFTDAASGDHPIVYVNPAFERITGYTFAELRGRSYRILSGLDTNSETLAQIEEAIRERRPCRAELLNYRACGKQFWCSLSLTPLYDAAGRLTHFVGVISDVTRRRSLEEQLRQSQKMDALGRMAGSVAHDFNNILTVILGTVECALEDLPADPARSAEWFREIGQATQRAAALTNQILVFSRKRAVESKLISLNDVLANLECLLRRLIGEEVSLVTNLSSDAGLVSADAGQIEQVLMNLAVNAGDAMPGGGTLTMTTDDVTLDSATAASIGELPAGRYVKLLVTDTGTGIPPEVLSRIFEPFFTTKSAGKGTGMGLATVFGIVKQGNGHIAAHSDPGRGATFQIHWPVADASAARRPSPLPGA